MKKTKKILVCLMVCILSLGFAPQAMANASTCTLSPTSVTCNYQEQSGYFYVYTSDSSWGMVSTATWINAALSGTKVTYKLTENPSSSTRTGTILVYGSTGIMGTFTITQSGK